MSQTVDRALTILALIGISMPVFWLAAILLYYLAFKAQLFPTGSYVPFTEDPWQWLNHLILPWFTLAVLFVGFFAWLIALVLGRLPLPLHRFFAAYVRYATHLVAFVYLIGRRFPGFTGREGSYGIDVAIDPPARQKRLTILVRGLLALPAFIVASTLGSVALVIGLLAWWYALIRARMPEGMRNLGVTSLRYSAQTYAYWLLVTARYPHASPVLRDPGPGPEPRPRFAPPEPVLGDTF